MKKKKNIKHFSLTKLFNIEDISQVKDADTWFIDSMRRNIYLYKNMIQNMKIYVENVYTIRDDNTLWIEGKGDHRYWNDKY